MDELQGKKLINLAGLQAFWTNVVNPKIDTKADKAALDILSQTVDTKANASDLEVLSQTVDTKANASDLEALSQTVNDYGVEISNRFDKFGEGEDKIEDVIAGIKTDIENVAAEAGVISVKGGDAADDLVQITVAGTENADAYQGNVTVSINDAKLVEALGTKAAQSDLDAAVGRIDTAEGKITTLEGAVNALSSATDFIGVTTTVLVDGAATNPIKINGEDYTAVKGDIVIGDGTNKEFIWDGGQWLELGDTTGLAQKVTALEGAVDGKAAQSDLDAAVGRIDTAEGKITTLEEAVDAIIPLTADEVTDAFNDAWEPDAN